MMRVFVSRVENDHDHEIQQLQPHPFSFRNTSVVVIRVVVQVVVQNYKLCILA